MSEHRCERRWFHRWLPDWCCSICAGFLPVENGGWPAPQSDVPNGPKCWCQTPLVVVDFGGERVASRWERWLYYGRSEWRA